MSKGNKNTVTKEVLIRHVFAAPVELVFKAWTTREYLERWYAPEGCTLRYKKLELREGGNFHLCINNPDFGDCWCIGSYQEIIKNKKIVYSLINSDENGNPIDPKEIGMDQDWPGETLVTVTFHGLDSTTEIVLHQTVPEEIAKRTGAHPSWIQMLERLDKEIHAA